jgi:hypothetical protein
MAYSFGGGVRPELGRTDYSGYLAGALQGAQGVAQGGAAIGQGIANAGEKVGNAMKVYGELKKENKVYEAQSKAYSSTLESMSSSGVLTEDQQTNIDKILTESLGIHEPKAKAAHLQAALQGVSALATIGSEVLDRELKQKKQEADAANQLVQNKLNEQQAEINKRKMANEETIQVRLAKEADTARVRADTADAMAKYNREGKKLEAGTKKTLKLPNGKEIPAMWDGNDWMDVDSGKKIWHTPKTDLFGTELGEQQLSELGLGKQAADPNDPLGNGAGAQPLNEKQLQAKAWAEANPKDPRAKRILQSLGL